MISGKGKKRASTYTKESLIAAIDKKCKPKSWFAPGTKIAVKDGYDNHSYVLSEPVGRRFHPEFTPELSPKQMLTLGVFEGKYLNRNVSEFPREWFTKKVISKLSPEGPDISLNYFGIKSRLSLKEWRKRGWVPLGPDDHDWHGWFIWYCRYYIGRRTEYDEKQIARWKSFVARHKAQVLKNCKRGDDSCRPRQKQGLLQWAIDPRKL